MTALTTVSDPSGTPSPVYNRSGTTVVEVAAAGTTQGGATPIPALSGHTIALVTPATDNTGVLLPDTAEIGDLVEVYAAFHTPDIIVYAPDGDSLNLGAGPVAVAEDHGATFRKVTATGWSSVGGV